MSTRRHSRISGSWVRTSEPLIWFGGAGHETRSGPDYFFDCRKRFDEPHVVIQLTLGGRGVYENSRGLRTPLPTGSAFIDAIPGKFCYGYPADATEPYELVYLSVVGAVAQWWRKRLAGEFGNILHFGLENPIAPQMLSIVHQHTEGTMGDRYLVSAQLYQLLMTMLSWLKQTRMHTTPLMTKALIMIAEQGHHADFQIEMLSSQLDCSREHLSRQFRVATGVSPSGYLIQHRLRLAAREIRATGDKLELIARRTGFSCANYLCRAFRQRFGITPAQFRARPQMAIV
jgi:AraC-like DNA-binding protein